MELLSKLGIDYKLLIAQIINFTILAFVLYKLVYKTVHDTLDRRSKIIEKGIHDAKASEDKLMKINEMSEQRMAETEKHIGALLEKARKDADVTKEEIVTAANAQSEDMLRRTRAQIAEEKEKLMQEITSSVGTLVIKLTTKILESEFTDADQKRLADKLADAIKPQ